MLCREMDAGSGGGGGIIQHIALVGIPPPSRKDDDDDKNRDEEEGADTPVFVIQLKKEHQEKQEVSIETIKTMLRHAIRDSIWSDLLHTNPNFSFVLYPNDDGNNDWPVDARHSSKYNRPVLRNWVMSQLQAATETENKRTTKRNKSKTSILYRI